MRQLLPEDLIELTRKPETSIRRDEQEALIPTPDFRIEFEVIPSWNEYIRISRYAGADTMKAKWRRLGAEKAIFYARRMPDVFTVETFKTLNKHAKTVPRIDDVDQITKTPFGKNVRLVFRYWRPDWRAYDVFNPFIKPIIDGFVDACLIANDTQEYFHHYEAIFMGVDRRFELSPEGKEARRIAGIGKKNPSKPVPARYMFDFYNPS